MPIATHVRTGRQPARAGKAPAGEARAFPPHLFDATVSLAELLGLSLEQTVDVLGSGWERCSQPGTGTGTGSGDGCAWFVAGEPAQVLVGVDPEQVLVACPTVAGTTRAGARPHGLGVEVLGSKPWWDPGLADWLRRTVAEAQRRRRRSFRYCRYCRVLTPPERRHSQDVCRRCAARYVR